MRSCAWPAMHRCTCRRAEASGPRTPRKSCCETGVARIVLGTAAIEDPALAPRCARRWPGRVAVGLDYRIGPDGVAEAQAQGWLAGSGRSLTELLAIWEGEPIGAVVATAVARDGMLSGPDLAASGAVDGHRAAASWRRGACPPRSTSPTWPGLRVGGRSLAGAIVGKAFVEGRFDVEEGLAACAASD